MTTRRAADAACTAVTPTFGSGREDAAGGDDKEEGDERAFHQ